MPDPSPHPDTLFNDARRIADPAARAAYLDAACADAPALRRQVDALLDAHGATDDFLESPPVAPAAVTLDAPPPAGPECPGTAVGPYKLLQQIGEGGMGVVFLAEQQRPVRRQVALKVIKAGMDTRQVVARFESERQALALMDHPNIAKVLDAGATDAGRPYFVMELVKGVPITAYCDHHRLTPRDRLALFVHVCSAVQHAHQKGIIHRDLKPSNVLVALYDGRPVPKVIDFGVAKATGGRLTEHTVFTGFGSVVGTPEYMSPEQAELNQLDVDTRSDVYSLGVLLYELLTGTTPIEVLRVVREEEAPRPSTRLSTTDRLASISACRGLEPRKLSGVVRGELDWIVMRCLEKDRARRYETASGLARDVERFLNDDAVQACPPSAAYRLRKFARRNKRALAGAAVICLALLVAVGAVAGSVGWVLRDKQTRLARTTGEVRQFLQRADALYQEENRLPEAMAEVQKARSLLAAGAGDDPALLREVRQRITDLETAATLDEIRLASNDHLDRERSYADYARAFRDYGIDVQALSHDEAVARISASRIRTDLALALGVWSQAETSTPGRWAALAAIANAADSDPARSRLTNAANAKDLAALRALAAATDVAQARTRTLAYLGASLESAGDRDAAIAFLRTAQRQHPGDFLINANLSHALARQPSPNWDEVIGFRRIAVALRPRSAGARGSLGGALSETPRLDDAVAEYRESLRLKPDFPWARTQLGLALWEQGKTEQAIAEYRETIRRKPDHAIARSRLGEALFNEGLVDQAIAEYREALRLKPGFAQAHVNLGEALQAAGQPAEAKAAFAAAAAAAREAVRLRPADSTGHFDLGQALYALGELDPALAAYREALRLEPKSNTHNNIAVILCDQGDRDRAIGAYREAIRLAPANHGAHANLASTYIKQGRFDDAERACREAIRLRPDYAMAHLNLASALRAAGRLDDALAASREAIRLRPGVSNHHRSLAATLRKQAKLPEAIAGFREAIRLDPANVEARVQLGVTLRMVGSHTESAAELREAIRINPKSADAHTAIGNVLTDEKLLDDAIAAYREAIRLDPLDHLPHNNLAGVLVAKRLPDQAIAAYREAIRLKPSYVASHSGLAAVLAERGLLDEAIQECREAVRLSPDVARCHLDLGGALARKGRLDDAVASFRRTIELEPKWATTYCELGGVLRTQGKLDDAVAAYRKAIELAPKYPYAHVNLGHTLETQGKADDAIACYRTATELSPRHIDAHCRLASALERKGLVDDAVAVFEKVTEANPNLGWARHNLALTLKRSGRIARAIVEFEKLLELEPTHAVRHNELAWLLATWPDPKFRNAPRAVELGRRAVELEPEVANSWNTLGAAHYRAGDWRDAVAAIDLRDGAGIGHDFFLLSMAHARSAHRDAAMKFHEQGVAWTQKHKPDDEHLRLLRTEAEELLKTGAPKPKTTAPTSPT